MVGYNDELSIGKDITNYKVLLCGDSIWITNYIKIIEYSEELIRLKVKNNILKIQGIKIKIKMLERRELLLSGKINSISLEKPYEMDV